MPVPNHPAFANLAIVFRGVDVSLAPLQLSPVAGVRKQGAVEQNDEHAQDRGLWSRRRGL